MKTMKSFLFCSIFLITTTFYASPEFGSDLKKDPFSEEITKMLSRSSIIIENDLKVKVIFAVTEDRKIEIRTISTSHAGVRAFLEARLDGQQLRGSNWLSNKIYELPVRITTIR